MLRSSYDAVETYMVDIFFFNFSCERGQSLVLIILVLLSFFLAEFTIVLKTFELSYWICMIPEMDFQSNNVIDNAVYALC